VAAPAESPTTDPNGEVDPVDGISESFDESVEALSAGWFSDPNAWPQIALWGMGLTLIALAAWRLSKKVHRNWVGALVGIGPFVVVLYFFFENVNRLLPPNL
jgi:sortase A